MISDFPGDVLSERHETSAFARASEGMYPGVVLNKLDLCSDEVTAEVERLVRGFSPGAAIQRCRFSDSADRPVSEPRMIGGLR